MIETTLTKQSELPMAKVPASNLVEVLKLNPSTPYIIRVPTTASNSDISQMTAQLTAANVLAIVVRGKDISIFSSESFTVHPRVSESDEKITKTSKASKSTTKRSTKKASKLLQ